jgi:glycosyltransferase involved in cell wall biosynthesis
VTANPRQQARVAAEVLIDAYIRPRPRASEGPLVTVVISAYNRSEVLRYALASAVRQSYRRLEILVVGDACTDDSEAVVARVGDPRVRWMNLAENSGSQAGPNQAALESAHGELIAYLGQDDVWRRDHVAVLVGDLLATGSDVSSTVTSYVWPRPLPVRMFASPPPGEYVPPSCLMHKRSAGKDVGGWRDWRETVRPPDTDFVWRLHEAGKRFSRVRALTVLKFASALRANSYRDNRFDEQAGAIRRIDGRGFVAREVLTAVAMAPLRSYGKRPAIDSRAEDVPGGVMREYRRIRGLA